MKIEEKAKVVEELKKKLCDVKGLWFTDFTGLPVADMMKLRRNLRDNSLTYHVIKKSILKRALEKSEIKEESEWFDGSCGVCMGNDVILGSRILSEFEGLKIKGAWFDGEVILSASVKDIAKIPGREVLIGKLLSDLKLPIFGFVWVLRDILSKMVYVLDGVRKAKMKGDENGKSRDKSQEIST